MSGAALAITVFGISGCKPSGQKVTLGPFSVDRFDATTPDGNKIDCYVFGAESNKPARLCGLGSPTPGFAGVMFNAVTPSADSKFVESFGTPLDPGYYLLKPIGTNTVDAWALGQPSMREWLGGGKKLLAVDTAADKHTFVRIIDPVARAEQKFDAGQTKADSFLLVRADNDAALILLQRIGGTEMIAVRDPLNSPDLTIADASDEKSPGNRKLLHRGDLDRQNGGVFKPNNAVTTSFKWEGGKWLFEGAPLGPFTEPSTH